MAFPGPHLLTPSQDRPFLGSQSDHQAPRYSTQGPQLKAPSRILTSFLSSPPCVSQLLGQLRWFSCLQCPLSFKYLLILGDFQSPPKPLPKWKTSDPFPNLTSQSSSMSLRACFISPVGCLRTSFLLQVRSSSEVWAPSCPPLVTAKTGGSTSSLSQ